MTNQIGKRTSEQTNNVNSNETHVDVGPYDCYEIDLIKWKL